MSEPKTPSEFLMSCLDEIDECDLVLIIRKPRQDGISFDTNTNSNFDSFALASVVTEFARAVIIKNEFADQD